MPPNLLLCCFVKIVEEWVFCKASASFLYPILEVCCSRIHSVLTGVPQVGNYVPEVGGLIQYRWEGQGRVTVFLTCSFQSFVK